MLRERLQRVPAVLVDVLLAVALAIAITVTMPLTQDPANQGRPDALAYGLGLTIAALTLFRRRWPLGVLLASTATLQVYYQMDYPGIQPALPLSVALATATAAGHPRWAIGIALWYVVPPVIYRTVFVGDPFLRVVVDALPGAALLGAVLLLGEAIRSRRALDTEHQLLAEEKERSERLLLNVLPGSVAARLKDDEEVIADRFSDVTVLFADVVDFTRVSSGVPPEGVVEILNDLFSLFDELAQNQGLEKIKTIGDAYMVAGGLPEPRLDHAEAVADMALAMRDEVARRTDPNGQPLTVRIGMDTGPVVAGVIGKNRFIYDVWGDTVNTASRMESHGVPGRIQVTARTYERLQDTHEFERRGRIPVKGKGEMATYFLLASRE